MAHFFIIVLILLSELWANGPVVISEIFPRGRIDQPEWIEIKNVTSGKIDLQNWKLSKGNDTSIISDSKLIIYPKDFLVLTRSETLLKNKYPLLTKIVQPSRWLSLNNYNDTIAILNNENRIVDMVCYSSSWFSGWSIQSLQRNSMDLCGMSSSAWRLAQPPTPGIPNRSIHEFSESISLNIGPVPFSPNGDGINDYLAIRSHMPGGYSLSVRIIGFDGKEILKLPVDGNLVKWDGRCKRGSYMVSGPFYVVAEFISGDGKRSFIRKQGILWR